MNVMYAIILLMLLSCTLKGGLNDALADATLTWEASITQGDITYNVYLDNEPVAKGIVGLSQDIGKTAGKFEVSSVLVNDQGEKIESERVFLIRPSPPPSTALVATQ